ncbi:MAG: hypothetical protein AABZ15_17410 [Nitrospirota bacterium]
MAKFNSHEEYDDWRSRQALKRQGAKDLKKMDAERPAYVADTKRAGIGITGYLVLAVAGIVCALYLTASGREFLGRIATFMSRIMR